MNRDHIVVTTTATPRNPLRGSPSGRVLGAAIRILARLLTPTAGPRKTRPCDGMLKQAARGAANVPTTCDSGRYRR